MIKEEVALKKTVGFTISTNLRNSVQFLYEVKYKWYSAIREN